MKYEKPEVRVLASALVAVRSQDEKGDQTIPDSQSGYPFVTNTAYQADE
jgi:hypothetical protein